MIGLNGFYNVFENCQQIINIAVRFFWLLVAGYWLLVKCGKLLCLQLVTSHKKLASSNKQPNRAHSSDGPEKQSKYCLLCFSRILDPAGRDRD